MQGLLIGQFLIRNQTAQRFYGIVIA